MRARLRSLPALGGSSRALFPAVRRHIRARAEPEHPRGARAAGGGHRAAAAAAGGGGGGGGGAGKGQQPLVPASSQLQPEKHQDVKMLMHIQVRSHEQSPAPGLALPEPGQEPAAENAPGPGRQPPAGSRQVPLHSWQGPVSPGHAQDTPGDGHRGSTRAPSMGTGTGTGTAHGDGADQEELQMDAGVIDRELHSQKEPVVQEPMMPDDAADPAQDPNNQGEDEFEEAELERPDFEEKVGGSEKFKEPRVKEEWKEKPPKDAGRAAKPRADPLEDYQEDQEQEIVRHQGGSWRGGG